MVRGERRGRGGATILFTGSFEIEFSISGNRRRARNIPRSAEQYSTRCG